MAAKLWSASTSNAFSTTLNGSITGADNTITLTAVAGLQFPGVLVIDRVDNNNVATPTVREYISFTGISTNTLTGVSRGLGGSSAQAHSSGGKVEEIMSISHWNDMVSFLNVSHDAAGNLVVSSTATIAVARVYTHLDASGASISGQFPIHPTWVVSGYVSLATTAVGKPTAMPQKGQWQFFSAVLRAPASGATLILDVNKNFTTIFSDQNTRLMVPAGGTYVSTASMGVLTFVSGDVLSIDIDQGGGLGQDLVVTGKGV